MIRTAFTSTLQDSNTIEISIGNVGKCIDNGAVQIHQIGGVRIGTTETTICLSTVQISVCWKQVPNRQKFFTSVGELRVIGVNVDQKNSRFAWFEYE